MIDEVGMGVVLREVVFVVCGLVLVVSCVVWCCSCCVFVCVTCFSSYEADVGSTKPYNTTVSKSNAHTPSPYKSPKPPSLLMKTRHVSNMNMNTPVCVCVCESFIITYNSHHKS